MCAGAVAVVMCVAPSMNADRIRSGQMAKIDEPVVLRDFEVAVRLRRVLQRDSAG